MGLLDNKDNPMGLVDSLNFKEKVDRSFALIKEAHEKYGDGLVVPRHINF